MTKVNRHRTYGTTPEWRIIAKSLIEPGMGTGRPLLNCDLRKPVKLTRNALPFAVPMPSSGLIVGHSELVTTGTLGGVPSIFQTR
jgi:hypothetical protein